MVKVGVESDLILSNVEREEDYLVTATGICSYCVAVAQNNSYLQEYTDFIRRSKHLPSVTKLLLTGLPGGVGSKGNRASRKRKCEDIKDCVALHSDSGANCSYQAAASTTPTVTSCATTSGYTHLNATSLPYDPVMPGLSGNCLPYDYGSATCMHPHHQAAASSTPTVSSCATTSGYTSSL